MENFYVFNFHCLTYQRNIFTTVYHEYSLTGLHKHVCDVQYITVKNQKSFRISHNNFMH